MEYKIGFFYNLPFSDNHSNRIIIVFETDHLKFKMVNPSLLPRLHYSNMTYYSFDYPIIYSEDNLGNIVFLKFLYEIPVRYSSEITGEGLELSIPFWGFRQRTNNPCKRIRFTTGERISNEISSANIFVDGLEIIPSPEDRQDENNYLFSLQENLLSLSFYKIVILYYVFKKIVVSIYGDTRPKETKSFIEIIEKAKTYLASFSINDILYDLNVEIIEEFRTKIGDDDSYRIYRNAHLSSSIANNDLYLQKIIGIGNNCIHESHGFCPARSMRIEGLVTGVYEGKDIENEKRKIIASYSKEEHLGYLLSEVFSSIVNNLSDFNRWETILQKYISFLKTHFRLETISNSKHDFEHNFWSLHHNIPNPQEVIDLVNNKILNITKCTLNKIILNDLLNTKFPRNPSPPHFNNEYSI